MPCVSRTTSTGAESCRNVNVCATGRSVTSVARAVGANARVTATTNGTRGPRRIGGVPPLRGAREAARLDGVRWADVKENRCHLAKLGAVIDDQRRPCTRSEEHTSELQ